MTYRYQTGALGPMERPTARELTNIYGEHQLAAALSQFSRDSLNKMASEEGVTPARARNETISRLVARVTEGRYNGKFGSSATKSSAETRHAARVSKMNDQIAQAEAKLAQMRAARDELVRNAPTTSRATSSRTASQRTQGTDAAVKRSRLQDREQTLTAKMHGLLASYEHGVRLDASRGESTRAIYVTSKEMNRTLTQLRSVRTQLRHAGGTPQPWPSDFGPE